MINLSHYKSFLQWFGDRNHCLSHLIEKPFIQKGKKEYSNTLFNVIPKTVQATDEVSNDEMGVCIRTT